MEFLNGIREAMIRKTFELSPNPAMDDLQKYLGIHFEKPIQKAVLTPRNQAALAAQAPLPPYNPETLQLIGSLFTCSQGNYIPRLKLFIVDPKRKPNIFTDYHETMHGYTDEMDPQFSKRTVDATVKAFRNGLTKGAKSSVDWETMLMWKIFYEGIATWGAVYTGRAVGGETKLFAKKFRNFLVTGHFSEEDLQYDHNYITQQFSKLKRMTHIDEHINRIEALDKLTDFQDKNNWTIYSIGYYFIGSTISELTKNGMSVADALNAVIKNPPLSIEQLRDYSGYAKSIK